MNEVMLFHTHGLGRFDFSSLRGSDLPEVDALASARSAILCPTIYLKSNCISATRALLSDFASYRANGCLSRIVGFSIEGPVLGPRGGIPAGSIWRPTVPQWREIASWFALGLKYVVVSPDVVALEDELEDGFTFQDLLALIYDAGGRVALGHFAGEVPSESASRVVRILDYLESRYEPSPYLVLTDHLFNDMPRNFLHAFRNEAENEARDAALLEILSVSWDRANLSELLGPVPAVLMAAAKERRLTPALNFDGGHVDLAICQRVVEHLTASRIVAMTDHTEVQSLAGEKLFKRTEHDLFFRGDGVLSASSSTHERQIQNMFRIGLDEAQISELFFRTPDAALNFSPRPIGSGNTRK